MQFGKFHVAADPPTVYSDLRQVACAALQTGDVH
jgi:hypothetical protein